MKFKAGDKFKRIGEPYTDYAEDWCPGTIVAICYQVSYANGVRNYSRIENFDEQFELAPAEPKFKAGDLIVRNDHVVCLRKVEEVAAAEDTYCLSFPFSPEQSSIWDEVEYIDSVFRKIGRAE